MGKNIGKKVAILAGASTAGVVALTVQYMLHSAPLPPRGEYFISDLARAQIGPVSIFLALASALALGFYFRASPVLVGLFMVAVFPIVAMYEGTRYRGSHNLIPFEMASFAMWSIPLIVAAWLGSSLARRFERRNRERE